MKLNIIRKLYALIVIISLNGLFLSLTAAAGDPAPIILSTISPQHVSTESRSHVMFEQNVGQFDQRVRFAARAGGAMVFLTGNEAVYVLQSPTNKSNEAARKNAGEPSIPTFKTEHQSMFALRMRLAGANNSVGTHGEREAEQRTNYFKGPDPAGWHTDIKNFDDVRVSDVYDGIDMVWRGRENGGTQYDFVVAPNTDPGRISLEFDGADNIEIDGNGDLLIHTAAGTIKQAKPYTFQEQSGLSKIEIESGFRIEGNTVKFDVGSYDHSKQLVIDPTVTINNLAFSTLIGSFGDDVANDIAVDANGCSYITGKTLSIAFPTTSGTFDTSSNGVEDVFVTKLNSSGTGIVFSTYLGGTGFDEARGINVDSAGNVYVGGVAGIAFPTTAGSFDTTFNGGADVFATKLNPSGSALIYSTYIGQSQIDIGEDIALDTANNLYIAGRTQDAPVTYPTTPGAFDTTYNGSDDGFLTKLNDTGSALVYSTYLGGSAIDTATAVEVNAAGEAIVSGITTDDVTDFPATAGSYDTTHNGITDIFVTRLNAAGSALVYSTFVGGPGIDNLGGMAIDPAGSVYVAGSVNAGYPITAGVLDTTIAGSNEIGLSKISSNGASLVYSTFIGGTQSESANGLDVDKFGNAYVTGSNFTGDYPTTPGAYDTTFNGSNDAILSIVNPSATAFIASTYIGGAGTEFANAVTLDGNGNIYLAGQATANASQYPVSPDAYQTMYGGGIDAFVTKFGDFSIGGKVVDTTGNPLPNVMVALSGQVSGTVITGTDGRFGFTDTVPGEPHSVSATRPGYLINPSLFNIASLANNRELIFVGAVGSPTGGTGGTLAFQQLSYNKNENGSSVTITVKRSGTITDPDPVTVDYATSDGTAVAGQDYQAASGVLTFAPFETTKTVTVSLVNDATLEPRETFSIALSNPTNSADIEPGRETTTVNVLDEDLADGSLLISEFRQRGRLGANDEYVKLYNPNDFDVTVSTADGSSGITLGRSTGTSVLPVVTIPNLVTIRSRGHYLLTNNSPNGGFSLIDYPTGRGTLTSVGDMTFSADIPDNSDLVLLNTSNPLSFAPANALDSIGFGDSPWAEGTGLPAINAADNEACFVRRLNIGGMQDTNSNRFDIMLVDNRANLYDGRDASKVYAVLGAPAPETSESLRIMSPDEVSIIETGIEVYDPTPVPNGSLGTLIVYRQITNLTGSPILGLRLRAVEFPTVGSLSQRRTSARPDFRLLNSNDSPNGKATTLAADRLQPNGGGLNSTLSVDSVTEANPVLPGQSVVVAIRFGVMRWGRHPFTAAVEALQ